MKRIIIPLIIILGLLGTGYYISSNMEKDILYSPEFPANTVINGVECGSMTVSEAADAITREWNQHNITFKTENEILGNIGLSGVTYDIEDQLQNIRSDYFIKTVLNHYFGSRLDLKVSMDLENSGKAFDDALTAADFLTEDVITETKDAYIDLDDPEMPIVKEVYGNTINYEKLKDQIFRLVADGTFGFQYIGSEFYEQPAITADSEELLKRQEFYIDNLTSNVTYTLGKDTVAISPLQMAEIRGVKVAENGPLTDEEINAIEHAVSENHISKEAVTDFVDSFAEKYNTLYSTREFRTSTGKTVTIVGGDYGFALDHEAEYNKLMSDLASGKPVKRDPVWAIKGFTDYQIGNDIGNTYVEISIKDQHLWYYKDGEKIVETDVVTGNPYMGYSTPTGTFSLTYKQLGATLRGEEADGTEYESPVTYWMPFYGNYGMHDATWRYYFGGNIYLGGGSHGCVNMPYEAAGKVFENIADSNVPVVIYND